MGKKVLSLFSGVGMFDYAFRKLGWETVAFAEQDKWCQRVLEKHWPGVPCYSDVKDITYERLRTDGVARPEVICGGFPCQDLSVAGKQAGIDGDRSGLWSEFARIISELRPRYVIVENVSALLTGDSGAWMRRVLGDITEIGYDCEWHVIPAGNADGRKLSAGAPHRRERVWIVAYPKNAKRWPRQLIKESASERSQGNNQLSGSSDAANSNSDGRSGKKGSIKPSMGLLAHGVAAGLSRSRWLPEPRIGRVATGVPDRVNKLKALGNGLVWQIPYAIGKAIMNTTGR